MLDPNTSAQLFAEWDDLSRADRWRRGQRARYMRLKPGSLRTLPPAAQGFADAVLSEIIIPHKAASLTTPMRPTTRQALAEASSALLANLLHAAAWGNWSAHAGRRERFTKLAIGHQAFTDCKVALEAAGLIVSVRGWSCLDRGSLPPMVRPTPELLEMAARHGVTAGGIADHFALQDPEASAEELVMDQS
jgi:hypothetical protein